MTLPPLAGLADAPLTEGLAVSVSGGKDSTALAALLKEQGVPYQAVFADTGWEHPSTYEYLERLAPMLGIEIVTVWQEPKTPLHPEDEEEAVAIEAILGRRCPMVRWAFHEGMFSSRVAKWCTRRLKTEPLDAWMHAQGLGLVAVGVRREESDGRAAFPVLEYVAARDLTVWAPCALMTEREIIGVHHTLGLEPNPLYTRQDAGMPRVGCWPCLNIRKDDLAIVARVDPLRIQVIGRVERHMPKIVARRKAEGRRKESAHDAPTFFGAPENFGGDAWPIERAVEWAQTARGGRQPELFFKRNNGCARWGMCEAWPEPPKEAP